MNSLLMLTSPFFLLHAFYGFFQALPPTVRPQQHPVVRISCHEKRVTLSQIPELLLQIINHHMKRASNR